MEENKLWFAVMRNPEDDDWSCGSYSYAEALAMVSKYIPDGGYIAVISEAEDPMASLCVDEIHFNN